MEPWLSHSFAVFLGDHLTTLCLGFLINKGYVIIPALPLDIWKGGLVESTISEKILTMDHHAHTCTLKEYSSALRVQPHSLLPIA